MSGATRVHSQIQVFPADDLVIDLDALPRVLVFFVVAILVLPIDTIWLVVADSAACPDVEHLDLDPRRGLDRCGPTHL